MSKEIKGVVNRLDLFTTPVWYVEKDLPEGAYEWALDIEKNVEGREVSNKGGGYQSQELEFEKIPYYNIIIMSFNTASDNKYKSKAKRFKIKLKYTWKLKIS